MAMKEPQVFREAHNWAQKGETLMIHVVLVSQMIDPNILTRQIVFFLVDTLWPSKSMWNSTKAWNVCLGLLGHK